MPDDPTAFFWSVAETVLGADGVETGTMMGFPCLRVRGAFFASCDHRSGDLIVKLPAHRVNELVDARLGQAFAPAGRTFREWLLVPDRDEQHWSDLIDEALAFVVGRQ